MKESQLMKESQPMKGLVVPLVTAAVIIPLGISLGVSALTWVLVVAAFTVTFAAQRQWQRTGRRWNWLMIAACITVVLALFTSGCSATYSDSPGPPYPPQVLGMAWANNSPSNKCALELMFDGSAAIATAFYAPAGIAVEWLGYQVTGEATPPGGSLITCWNYAQRNWPQFTTYTQCFGQPVLRRTWNDYRQGVAWIQIPSCVNCNRACQAFSNFMHPFFIQNRDYCQWAPLDLLCWPLNHQATAMTTETEPNSIEPLPAEFDTTAWDVTAPVPDVARSQQVQDLIDHPLTP